MRKKSDPKSQPSRRSPRVPAEGNENGRDRRAPGARTSGVGRLLGSVVSRRHERGVPYPGDFPNPLSGKYPGCY
ncbi:MAG: hypothetical protein WKG32_23690 [Gemmatimonadaceae bacterium]